jgi:hypothetical protein
MSWFFGIRYSEINKDEFCYFSSILEQDNSDRMDNNIEPAKDSIILSVEQIIDLIRSQRNELAKQFLNDQHLSSYYKQQFNKEVSNIKREFIKRELKELLIEPVDLVHYAGLINEKRENNSIVINEKELELFYKELNIIFRKYSM